MKSKTKFYSTIISALLVASTLLSCASSKKNGDFKLLKSEKIIETDESGNFLKEILNEYDKYFHETRVIEKDSSGKIISDCIIKNEYENELLKKVTCKDSIQDEESEIILLEYDNKKNIIKDSRKTESGEFVSETIYEYDKKGFCVKETITFKEKGTFVYENEYDKNGFTSREIVSDGREILYENTNDGMLLKATYLKNGKITEEDFYENNEFGYWTKETIKKPGEPTIYRTHTFTYY